MTEIQNPEENSIKNSLGLYGLISFLIFLLYTFIVALGIFMFLSTVQLGFFGNESEGFFIKPDLKLTSFFNWLLSFEWFRKFLTDSLFVLVISYIYTIAVWIYVYYSTVKPSYNGKEKEWHLGWYLETWFFFISIFFIPVVMIVQNLPFRAKNVVFKFDLNLRLHNGKSS
ncbi:MAG: hypothetical protein ACFFFH_13610 [Candidatus Thorarchaeota archaeon]